MTVQRARTVHESAAVEVGHCMIFHAVTFHLLRLVNVPPRPRGCFGRLILVRRRSHDLPKRHGGSDPADRDSAGSNSVLTTANVSCSRISHISSLVLLSSTVSLCS